MASACPHVEAYVESLRRDIARSDTRVASGSYIVTPSHADHVAKQRRELALLEGLSGPDVVRKEAELEQVRLEELRAIYT